MAAYRRKCGVFAADYARFVIHWLSPRWTSALASANRVSEHVAGSMGWGVQTNDLGSAFFHRGDNGGYKNFVLAYPERRAAVVVVTNGARRLRLAEDLLGSKTHH